jgi:hypothetical protein
VPNTKASFKSVERKAGEGNGGVGENLSVAVAPSRLRASGMMHAVAVGFPLRSIELKCANMRGKPPSLQTSLRDSNSVSVVLEKGGPKASRAR